MRLPCWRVTFILHGVPHRSMHTCWADGCPLPRQQTNFTRIQKTAEDALHTHHCRDARSTLQETFASLSQCTCLQLIILLFASERQHNRVKKGQDALALDPNLLHWASEYVPAQDNQPAHRPCYPRLKLEARALRQASQEKPKIFRAFPQGDALHFITWCRANGMILDAVHLQSNVANLCRQCSGRTIMLSPFYFYVFHTLAFLS